MYAVVYKKTHHSVGDWGDDRGTTYTVIEEFEDIYKLKEWIQANSNILKFRVLSVKELEVKQEITLISH